MSGEGGFFWQRYPIKTIFANVAGLKPGAPVRVAGVEVGSVTDVTFIGDRVEVLMEVSKDHAAAHHHHVGGVARVGVAARRVGGGHHRVVQRHAGAGVGLREVGPVGRDR